MIPGIKEDVKELEEELTKIDYAKVESNIMETCKQISEVIIENIIICEMFNIKLDKRQASRNCQLI